MTFDISIFPLVVVVENIQCFSCWFFHMIIFLSNVVTIWASVWDNYSSELLPPSPFLSPPTTAVSNLNRRLSFALTRVAIEHIVFHLHIIHSLLTQRDWRILWAHRDWAKLSREHKTDMSFIWIISLDFIIFHIEIALESTQADTQRPHSSKHTLTLATSTFANSLTLTYFILESFHSIFIFIYGFCQIVAARQMNAITVIHIRQHIWTWIC